MKIVDGFTDWLEKLKTGFSKQLKSDQEEMKTIKNRNEKQISPRNQLGRFVSRINQKKLFGKYSQEQRNAGLRTKVEKFLYVEIEVNQVKEHFSKKNINT